MEWRQEGDFFPRRGGDAPVRVGDDPALTATANAATAAGNAACEQAMVNVRVSTEYTRLRRMSPQEADNYEMRVGRQAFDDAYAEVWLKWPAASE